MAPLAPAFNLRLRRVGARRPYRIPGMRCSRPRRLAGRAWGDINKARRTPVPIY